MSQMTIQFLINQESIVISNLKRCWVYQISQRTGNCGLAFSDDNWDVKTIYFSQSKKYLNDLKDKLEIAYYKGEPTFKIIN